jgi:UDP-N-acetyl-D-mannosaminuronic acid dehydrogenase
MRISVIGLGYVGLPTAALAAAAGHRVYGFDRSPSVRDALSSLETHKLEEPVRALFSQTLRNGTLNICDRIQPADVYIVCVPTPCIGDRPDMHHVESAMSDVATIISSGEMIVLESTVPPGTTDRAVRKALMGAGKSLLDVGIVHAPERILPGDILRELRENDRIIGGRTPADASKAAELYASFVSGRIHVTDLRTAEFVKVIENTYRDINIAFANELAIFCEEIDIDVWRAIDLANNHPRVQILKPGPGVGGHCIPIDPRFLADQNPFATELIQASRRVNERMPNLIARRIGALLGDADGEKKVALLGASYKANVDDVRESPAVRLRVLLEERGYRTATYDPVAGPPHSSCLEAAVAQSDAVVLAVNHDVFRDIFPEMIAPLVRTKSLVDCHNFFSESQWSSAGFRVYALGRGFQSFATQRVPQESNSA